MTDTELKLWELILSSISTMILIVAAIAGAIRYFDERRRDREARQEELAWRKTQFVLELADKFETDERYQVAGRLLEYEVDPEERKLLNKVLCSDSRQLGKKELELRHSINHYLDFFDRLYHFTFVTCALNIADIKIFAWYVEQINAIEEIRHYAGTAGFNDVLALQGEIHKRFGKEAWVETVGRTVSAS